MANPPSDSEAGRDADMEPRELEVVIEVPRGSFFKRALDGRRVFILPLPRPFNYGAVPAYLGLESDLLDAVVLGPNESPKATASASTR